MAPSTTSHSSLPVLVDQSDESHSPLTLNTVTQTNQHALARSQPNPSLSSEGFVLITGAARGMGRGIVLRLADNRYDVAVNDLPGAPELDEVVETSVNNGSASHLHTRRRFG